MKPKPDNTPKNKAILARMKRVVAMIENVEQAQFRGHTHAKRAGLSTRRENYWRHQDQRLRMIYWTARGKLTFNGKTV